MTLRPLRGVGVKLGLASAFVVAVSLGVVYLIVIPSLEQRLIDAKLAQLTSSAAAAQRTAAGDRPPDARSRRPAGLRRRHCDGGQRADADRRAARRQDGLLHIAWDSSDEPSRSGLIDDEIALRAVVTGTLERGVVTRNDQQFAEVAVPVVFSAVEPTVLLLSAPLQDAFPPST